MIELTQWRASIGHWYCSLRSTCKSRSVITIAYHSANHERYMACLFLNMCFFVLVSICHFFLLLLSGDIETNPGPTTQQVCQMINDSLRKHYIDLKQVTCYTIRTISDHLFAKGLISDSVKGSPTLDNILDEFKSGLFLCKDVSQCQCYCQDFIECLSSPDGPSSIVSSKLAKEWDAFFHSDKGCYQPTSSVIKLQPFTKEDEQKIKTSVTQLHKQFADLLKKLKEDLKSQQVTEMIECLRNNEYDTLPFEEFKKCCTDSKILIEKLEKYYDFLDCDILLVIAEKFATPNLSQCLENHSEAAANFRSSKTVQELRDGLESIFEPYIDNISNAPKAYIRLHNVWNKITINKLRILIKCFFPDSDHLALSKHIIITKSSVLLTYFMTESARQIQEIISHAHNMVPLMRIIGVYELTINGQMILHETVNENFTFEFALIKAAKIGHSKAVELLIDILPWLDLNIRDDKGRTALMLASQNGHCKVVELLLKKRANAKMSITNGHIALFKSSQKGFYRVVELLLKEHADPNVKTSKGWTALMVACQNGHTQVAELLIKESANLNIQNTNGSTALFKACYWGHYQIIELLLKELADPNTLTTDGWTALMAACQNGHHHVVELLLKAQANADVQTTDGSTALMIACENGHYQIVELLLKNHANPNTLTNDGWTALMAACQNGHHHVVELLLKAQANADIQTTDGSTALMMASENGHYQIVELLLKLAQTLPNNQTTDGWTALMLASQNGHLQVAELLLQSRADPNIQNINGLTALFKASQNGHYQLVELLLKKYANPNIQNKNGWTALLKASRDGHYQVVESLLKGETNLNIQNTTGWTALMLASVYGHHHVVELLLEKQADPFIHNSKGKSALMLAREKGHHHVVKLLQLAIIPQVQNHDTDKKVNPPNDTNEKVSLQNDTNKKVSPPRTQSCINLFSLPRVSNEINEKVNLPQSQSCNGLDLVSIPWTQNTQNEESVNIQDCDCDVEVQSQCYKQLKEEYKSNKILERELHDFIEDENGKFTLSNFTSFLAGMAKKYFSNLLPKKKPKQSNVENQIYCPVK